MMRASIDSKRNAGLSRLGAAALITALASGQVLGGWYFLNRVQQPSAQPIAAMTVSSPEIEALRQQLNDINADVAQISSERDALRRDRDSLAESKVAELRILEESLKELRSAADQTREALSSKLDAEAEARKKLQADLTAAREARAELDKALAAAKEQAAAAKEQAKKAEDQAKKAEEARQRYEVIVQRLESSGLNVKRRAGLTNPPDLKAVVVRVMKKSEPTRLVIDVGLRHGIERDDVFQLSRAGKELGKARVVSVDETLCLARVIELKAANSVQAGDSARTVRGPTSDQ